jgi:excisionase family DNA binding protein
MPRSIADVLESMGRLLTAKELAPMLAMSKSTLYDRAKDGTIPATSTGGTDVRFDPYLVAQWLRSRTV